MTATSVSTSVAAFVGFTLKGEADKALMVRSFLDFERRFGGLDPSSPASYAVRQFFLNGGAEAIIVRVARADGGRGGPAELVGDAVARTGIYALLDVDLFNLLVIPETLDMTSGEEVPVIRAATELCEMRRAFYVVDAPSNRTLADVVGAWAATTTQSRNAATYFPPVRIADPLDGMRPRTIAPSGTLAGVYARIDATRGVWKAPAGVDATLTGVLDLASPVTDIEGGRINTRGINPLRRLPTTGPVAWGARTMRGADALVDEYKYIAVRRLALFIEESLVRRTKWVAFEPNEAPLWMQIRSDVEAFMNDLFRNGAFAGSRSNQAYFVTCGNETTTQNDLDDGVVNILVGFAPLKPAEFIIITIRQVAGGPR